MSALIKYSAVLILSLFMMERGIFGVEPSGIDFLFENINVNDGLSQSTGRVILQDSKGFIWIGTQDGLNKYDGYSFTIYNNNPLDSNSLADNFIFDLIEDRDGIIWIGYNGGGVDRFDPDTESFQHYKNRVGDSTSLNNNTVLSIYEDHYGAIWLGTGSGMSVLNKSTGTFKRIALDGSGGPEPAVNCFYEDSNNNFWIGANGLYLFDPKDEKVVAHYSNDPNINSISGNNVVSIVEDCFGDLWISSMGRGVNRLDLESGIFTHYLNDPNDHRSLSSDNVFKIYETNMGEEILWFGTQNGGLNRYDRDSDSFISYMNDTNDPFSISNNIVFGLAMSTDGSLWIGTGGGGINKISLKKPKFQHYKYPGNILANFIWAIFEDETGLVWIGSQGYGLYSFERDSHEYQHYEIDQENPELSQILIINSALQVKDHTFWLATSLNGLYRINDDKGIRRNYRYNPADSGSIRSNGLRVVYESHDGTIWVGLNGSGLEKFDPDTESFIHFANIPGDTTSLSSNQVYSIYEDSEHYIWVGTFGGGINKLDPSTGLFQRFIHSADPASISNDRIRSINEDNNGVLWVGTDHGLNRFDRNSGDFTSYTTRDGLPNNVIYSILPDQNGNLWLSTNRGLSKFNPDSVNFRNYDEEDGLQSNEFNTGAYFLSESGEMYFAGINGFNIFHPDSIHENSFIPPVMITNFKLFNQTVEIGPEAPLKQNITETDEIILSHRQNFLTFEFSAFNYINGKKNRYKYMMEGVNPDWVDAGNQRFADYQGLRPGKYIFKVIGSNNDGKWNLEGDRLRVIIKPPWWGSLPAYFLYLLLIVLFILGYIRFRTIRLTRLSRRLELQVEERTRQISLQKEEIETQKNVLEELNASKDKLFRIVAHDLKNPMTALLSITNSLNIGYHQLEDRDKEESIKQANKAAEDLHLLLENLLQWTTSQTGKLNFAPENFALDRLARENISLAEPAAKKKNIILESTIGEGLIVYADRNMISTVLRNLLSNAIKFTPSGGRISLSVSEMKGDNENIYYKVTVADSGIGIPKEKIGTLFQMDNSWTTKGTDNESGTGLGLLICQDFVNRNGGNIELESTVGEGSRFNFTLPAGSREA